MAGVEITSAVLTFRRPRKFDRRFPVQGVVRMLSAIVVAVAFVEPAVLDRVPITPALLEGRWKLVYYPHELNVVLNVVYRKDGTFSGEQYDKQTGEKKEALTHPGTYTIRGRRIFCTLQGSSSEPRAFDIKLLPGGRMRAERVGQRGDVCVYVKVADR